MVATHPDVELRIPADSAFLAVLRTATAGLAARLDFTLDDIEDLRIAVDEACAMVLPQARAGSDLTCAFELGEGALPRADGSGVLPDLVLGDGSDDAGQQVVLVRVRRELVGGEHPPAAVLHQGEWSHFAPTGGWDCELEGCGSNSAVSWCGNAAAPFVPERCGR